MRDRLQWYNLSRGMAMKKETQTIMKKTTMKNPRYTLSDRMVSLVAEIT